MTFSPRVSVVLGVRGGGGLLAESLDSVFSQEGVALEVILVVDGALDERDAVDLDQRTSVEPERLRVLRRPAEGLTRALIDGCLAARGDYFARIDVGDRMHPGRLTRQAAVLDAHPDCVLVACATEVCGPQWEPIRVIKGLPRSDAPVSLLGDDPEAGLAGDIPHHGSTMFRRAAYFACGGYRGDFYYGQDWDLWYRLAECGTYLSLPEVLYSVRLFPDSISMRKWRQQRLIAECSRGAFAARRRGGDEGPFLTRARAIRPGGRTQPAIVAASWWMGGDGSYHIGEALRRNRDARCERYLRAAIRCAPLNPRPYVRLVQLRAQTLTQDGIAGRLRNRARDFVFANPRAVREALDAMRGSVTGLLYHRVDDPERIPWLTRGGSPVIRPEELDWHLRWLVRQGARFYTFADLRAGEYPGPDEIGILLSFDDGFRDGYTQGLEVLSAHGVRAVFFQCSAFLHGQPPLLEHALYWRLGDTARARRFLARAVAAGVVAPGAKADTKSFQAVAARLIREVAPSALRTLLDDADDDETLNAACEEIYPTVEDLRRAQAQGSEIGSHGHAHLHRGTIDTEAFQRDVLASKQILTGLLGAPPAAYSFPFNSRAPGDAAFCGQHFAQVVTVDPGRITASSDPFSLPRFTWPGSTRNPWRRIRWLATGSS